MSRLAAVAALAIVAVAVAACSTPPDPELQSLAEGYWYGTAGPNEFIYELTFAGGRLAGAAHMLQDGRQLTESTIIGGRLDGYSLELSFSGIPPYRGELDPNAGRIVGGHPGVAGYEDVELTKVDKNDWPMVEFLSPWPGESGYAWTRPAGGDDGWETATPEEVGMDTAAVEQTITAILDGQAGALHSMLVVRNGKLAVEEYFHGWGIDAPHRVASVTKSISSLLVGIAIDGGEIESVDARLLDFFPDRAAEAGEGWDRLTLEHLLTMSMDLDWSDLEAETFPRSDADRFTNVISRGVRDEPGKTWRYVSRNVNLLAPIIRHATGVHADEYAAEHLFAPLGITLWDWDNNRFEGYPDMSGTLTLRPRDMAKIGQLLLNEGSWEGQPVVSAGWIHEATAVRFHPSSGDEYGYLWWGFEDPPPGIDFATGVGSQYIITIPAFDMVLVTTGGNDFNNMQTAILGVTEQYLLPGIH